jgi:prepilin-type N-terminal cleavage/methylation domain-containing protein
MEQTGWKVEAVPMPISAHPTKSQDGFTLVEVLTALTLLAVISVLLSQVLQGILQIHTLNNAEPETIKVRQEEMARQFSGETEEPVLTMKPVEEP